MFVAVKDPVRLPLVNSLTSDSLGVKPVGANAHTEAKFVALNPNELTVVLPGAKGTTTLGLVIATGPVVRAWAGLMPATTAPAAATKKLVLRIEKLGMAFWMVEVCEPTIPEKVLKGACQAAIGCKVRVRWQKRSLSPGRPDLLHQRR